MAKSILITRVSQRLNKPFSRRKKLGRAFQQCFIEETKQMFARQQGPDGQPWAPLTPAYAARKQGPQILIETGRLYDSLTRRKDPDHLFRGRGNKLRLGTKVPYAAAVNARRPFLFDNSEVLGDIFGYSLVAKFRRRDQLLRKSRLKGRRRYLTEVQA